MGLCADYYAPKIARKLIEWKAEDKNHDADWQDFVCKNPNFAQLVAIFVGTHLDANARD